MRMFYRKLFSLFRKMYVDFYRKAYGIPKGVEIRGKVFLEARNITYGQNITIFPGVHIWGTGKIVLGDNVSIGKDTIIYASKEIIIGEDVSIAGQSYIIDCDHGITRKELIRKQGLISAPIYIGRDSWIGAGVKVLKGSYISEGAVIGAMGLVNGFVEPYSINVGIPVKKISERK